MLPTRARFEEGEKDQKDHQQQKQPFLRCIVLLLLRLLCFSSLLSEFLLQFPHGGGRDVSGDATIQVEVPSPVAEATDRLLVLLAKQEVQCQEANDTTEDQMRLRRVIQGGNVLSRDG